MACFATKPATGQALAGDDVGAVARLFEVLVVDGFHHWVRHVQGGQVEQFERAEFEAHLVFQYPVDGGEISNAFGRCAQGLCDVTAPRVVDDETGRVFGPHPLVTHGLGQGHEALASGFAGGQTGHNFHHFHQRHRVEKMKAREALRVLHVGGQRRDRQRRCDAGQDGGLVQQVFELGNERLFDREVFHHGFNHDMAWSQVVEVFGGFQATAEILNLLSSEAAFFL